MFRKNISKIPLSFSLVFVLFMFSASMTSFADDECPCFTARDLKRFTPPYSPFTCFLKVGVPGEESDFLDARISQKGEYLANFYAAQSVCMGCADDLSCGAYAVIGDLGAPTVVLLGDEDGLIEIKDLNVEEFNACWNLLNTNVERIGACDFDFE